VFGSGVSGCSAARLALRLGAQVMLVDDNPGIHQRVVAFPWFQKHTKSGQLRAQFGDVGTTLQGCKYLVSYARVLTSAPA
jgi:UDP-N-acetylmuramoylalanine-D-glutamate ligase